MNKNLFEKILFCFLLVMLTFLCSSEGDLSLKSNLAFAEIESPAGWTWTRKSVTTNTALTLPAGTWVVGIGIHASSENAQMGIYDSATLAAATAPIDEVGEATQFDSNDRPWVREILFVNGVTIIVNNGVAFIDYLAAP